MFREIDEHLILKIQKTNNIKNDKDCVFYSNGDCLKRENKIWSKIIRVYIFIVFKSRVQLRNAVFYFAIWVATAFENARFVPNCVWPSSSLLRIELELRDCNRASAFSVASPHLLALVSLASKPELPVSPSIYCTRVAVTRLLRSFRVAIDRGTSSLDWANHIEPSDRHEAVDWCSRIEAKVEGIEASSLASSHRALRLRRTGGWTESDRSRGSGFMDRSLESLRVSSCRLGVEADGSSTHLLRIEHSKAHNRDMTNF